MSYDHLSNDKSIRGSCGCFSSGSSDPVIKNVQQGWWRNFLLLGLLITVIVGVSINGGLAYGLSKSGPMMEATSAATLGMRHDTKQLIGGITAQLNKILEGYPDNQFEIWTARGDSLFKSVEKIVGKLSGAIGTSEISFPDIANTVVKAVSSELLSPGTKVKLNAKISQFLDKMDINEFNAVISNFNKVAAIVEKASQDGVVSNANQLIRDVDKTVTDFVSGRSVTIQAKMGK